eukprot:g11558.t1
MNATAGNQMIAGAAIPFVKEASIALLFFSIWCFETFTENVLKTSPLLGAICAGVIVGPVLQVAPYPNAFAFMGKIGVMLLVLESSLEVKIEQVKSIGPRAFLAATFGVCTPVLLSLLVMCVVFQQPVRVGLAVGSAIAPTSLGFSAKLLGSELKTDFGQTIAIAAVVDDVLSLMLLGIIQSLDTAVTTWDYCKPIVGSLGSIVTGLLMIFFVLPKPLLLLRSKIPVKQQSNMYIILLLALSICFAWLCAIVGSSDLLGVFTAGLVVGNTLDFNDVSKAFEKNFGVLTTHGTSLFFACTIGYSFAVGSSDGMFSGPAIGKGAILTLVAIVGKMLPLGLFAKPLTLNNFLKFSFAMNGRGEFSFLIAKEAKEQGILNSSDFSATIWGAFVSSLLAPFLFRWARRRESLHPSSSAKNVQKNTDTKEVQLQKI